MEQGPLAISGEQIKQKENIKLRYDYLLWGLLGFVMGQAELGTGLFSFSLIYWSIFVGKSKYLLGIVSLTTALGLLETGNWTNIIYLLSGFAGLIVFRLSNKQKDDLPLFISLAYLIGSFSLNFYYQSLLYVYLINLGETLVIYLLITLVRQGSKTISWKRVRIPRISKITLIILSNGILIGLANLSYINNISLFMINIIVLIIIIGAAKTEGITSSVTVAVIFSLVLLAAEVIPTITMIKYTMAAIISGLFARYEKKWMLVAVLLSLLLYSGFSPSIYNLQQSSIEVVIAGIIFLIIPLNIWEKLVKEGQKDAGRVKNINYDSDYSNLFKHQFSELGNIFAEMGSAFNEVIPGEEEEKNKRLDDFVFLYKNKICRSCPRKCVCWQQEKEDIYQKISTLACVGQKKGKINKKLLKKYMGNKCSYHSKVISGVKSCFELFQLNNFWRNRLIDEQQIVADQLQGVSQIINRFSEEESLILQDSSLDHIRERINKHEIDLYKINVNPGMNKISIRVELEPCVDNKPCQYELMELLNAEYEYDFRILKKSCGNKLKDKPCVIEYGPCGEYNLDIAIEQQSLAENVCGDSYLYKKLSDGRDLLVLSDGMGVGEEAASESKTAIALLERIVDAQFDQNLAIKTINSALFLRNQDDKFTTLDICLFDTFTGELSFRKIGAMVSYVKRGWDLIEINSSSIPVGILDQIEVSSESLQLLDGDFVVMLSDGVVDTLTGAADKEKWFKQMLQNTSFEKAKELSQYIMEVIMEEGRDINDDMTVIVFKVNKIK